MPMFLGTYTPKVDDKGRFFLPAKFRDELVDGLVIAKGQDRCLAIFTPEVFQQEAAKAMSASATLRTARNFQRMLAAGASVETPDKQGRVTIPPLLRAYAGLDKEIAVIGAFNRIEIWDLETWMSFSDEQDDVFAGLNEEIFPGGAE